MSSLFFVLIYTTRWHCLSNKAQHLRLQLHRAQWSEGFSCSASDLRPAKLMCPSSHTSSQVTGLECAACCFELLQWLQRDSSLACQTPAGPEQSRAGSLLKALHLHSRAGTMH
ncbi:hypothetical protein CgunFtcFv8_015697 [Champsocephalus gunnari]|uniref:Uncharacterized protein n=1 Tax=Champsocephalus gunnari TaxID=52237 RepID=A0AAN8CA04_CHAGU|nr:hypothetical protein CgunFtcFv8_015697 [Champsocephalus gunnari]